MQRLVGIEVGKAFLPAFPFRGENRGILENRSSNILPAVCRHISRCDSPVGMTGNDGRRPDHFIDETNDVVSVPVDVVQIPVMGRLTVPVNIY